MLPGKQRKMKAEKTAMMVKQVKMKRQPEPRTEVLN